MKKLSPKNSMGRKHRSKIVVLKAAVSAAFFFILFSFVQHNELLSVFKKVNWTFFVLSFVLAIIMLFVSCMKWKVLLEASGHKVDFITLLRFYLIGYFFSNLLPSTIGGDVARSYYSGRYICNQTTAAAAIFLERFTGMLCLLLLVIVSPLMQLKLYYNPLIYIPVMGALAFFLVIFWVWVARDPFFLCNRGAIYVIGILKEWSIRSEIKYFQFLVAWSEKVYNGIMERLRKFRRELRTSLSEIRSDKKVFFFLVILTVLFYFLTWINVYLAFLTFNVHPGFLAVCALVPAIMFVGQVPLTLLGNLGFIESVFVVYFMLAGMPAAETLAMGLLLRLKIFWLGVMGYFFYLSLSRENKQTFNSLDT